MNHIIHYGATFVICLLRLLLCLFYCVHSATTMMMISIMFEHGNLLSCCNKRYFFRNILSSRVSLIHSWKLSRNQFLSNFSTCLIKHRLFLSSLFVALFLPKVNGHIVLFLFERHIFTFKTLNTDKCLR